ncbi:hypothetical protein F4803DRAFT_573395 [Xylaria telfairii]|nr:hypothetical protein F4803DRAFT_573395 [Xylaria telfairii]
MDNHHASANNDSPPASPNSDTPQFNRLPIRQSLGSYGCLGIMGGSIAALGLLSFLFFLWFGHGSFESADATWAWRQIATHDFMTEAVTLTSLALRSIISLQSTICTSMLAALMLEKGVTRKLHVAWFSIIRSMNDGPTKMITMLCSRYLHCVEFWLLLLLAIVTFGLQLASTILLLDFTNSVIIGDVSHIEVPDLMSPNGTEPILDITLGSFYVQKPTYGVFGKTDSSSDVDVSPDSRGYSHTGIGEQGLLLLDLEPRWNASQEPWSKDSTMFLVVSSNIEDASRTSLPGLFPKGIAYHEWMSYEIIPDLYFNISLCFAGHMLERKLVNMTATWTLAEPAVNWSAAVDAHSTSDVQRHLGSTLQHSSLADRNILKMQIFGEPDDGPPSSPANQEYPFTRIDVPSNVSAKKLTTRLEEYVFLEEIGILDAQSHTYPLCEYCNTYSDTAAAPPESGVLFSDIIAQTVHYSFFGIYDIFHEAQVVRTLQTRTPPRCTESSCAGLISVTVLLALHLTNVAIITVLYVTRVRFSRFGNIWHTCFPTGML